MNPVTRMDRPGVSASATKPAPAVKAWFAPAMLAVACLLIAGLYCAFADLKGIGTDEGFRLGIINGGREFTAAEPGTQATWGEVLKAITPYAYQPLYFLLQNTVMRVGGTHDELVLKYVNVFFLWLSLQGLLALSRGWALAPRLCVVGLFALNAFLFMHVLQLREYIVGISVYVWSSWLVLRLDRRPLDRGWADTGWFAAYGGLLALGFFTQTWVVFPAVAQGLFLILRRAGDRLRFYAQLAVSYVIVLSLAYPYLVGHRQKVDIGQWGTPGTLLWPRMADGFHFVLSGHAIGRSPAADFFCGFWLLLLAAGAGLLARRKFPALEPSARREYQRQGLLMLLCLGVSVVFQIGYFLKVDTLSIWPRYFALHYFFLLWLVGLAFKCLHDLATTPAVPAAARRWLKSAVAIVLAVLVANGIFQTWSYHRDPYADSGLNPENNWRVLSAELARVIQPGDVVLTQDFVHAWTLTFTRPLPNKVLSVQKMGDGSFDRVDRFLYLESDPNPAARAAIVDRLAGLGYGAMQEVVLPATGTVTSIPAWRILVFQRR